MFQPKSPAVGTEILAALTAAARERILILDGAMGTQIQGLGLERGRISAPRPHRRLRPPSCKGNNDLLILTQPDAIEAIHSRYCRAGADIIETNTFSSTSIAQADYGMQALVYELNREGARLAREAAAIAPRRRTAAAASSPARSGRPTAPPRSRPTSTIPASARSASTTCASPMASSCAG